MENIINIAFLTDLYKKFQSADIMASLLKILIIVLISLVVIKIASKFVNKLRKVLEKTSLVNDERVKLRTKTICGIINSCIMVFVGIISVILILGELGINIAPILAGAGVLGLAVSFGAQNLVKDVITGFFILFEDQFGIGDVIKIDDHAGIVENMNLRTTILRDLSGNVHIIPNGEIKQVVVMTKHWARAVVDIQVFYKQDINKILDIITDVTSILYKERNDQILEAPEVLGINSIDSNGVTIRVMVKTKPAEQWSVEREIRRRVIERFNEQGIDLPYFQSSSLENLK
jgi:small conductance mechanosensitive channel